MINRKLIQSILQKIGFKSRFLQFAINGLEACEKAEYDGSDNENKQFHIILMDMHMVVILIHFIFPLNSCRYWYVCLSCYSL